MAVNAYKIKKWFNMLIGNSVYHVNQDVGKIYSKTDVKGYYNDLTEKVLRFGLSGEEIPKVYVDSGDEIYFSIGIFQYGLGAYDLYLINNDQKMLMKAKACADWAISTQKKDGSWETFANEIPTHPYSSMAQGEGVSLLVRIYKEMGEEKYLQAAQKAMTFMLTSVENGGTTKYVGEDIYLLEYTNEPLVLNGWIFSVWGLIDYYKLTKKEGIKKIIDGTLKTMEKKIPDFDNGYWSKYEDGKRICSLFYHKLHIAQLKVMYELTGVETYKNYAQKWDGYLHKFFNPKRAFVVKAWQKVIER